MIRIFEYLQELDCFVVNPDYKKNADSLGLTEWNEVVWIGRFLAKGSSDITKKNIAIT